MIPTRTSGLEDAMLKEPFNPTYGDVIDGACIQNLPEDAESPNLRTVELARPCSRAIGRWGDRLY